MVCIAGISDDGNAIAAQSHLRCRRRVWRRTKNLRTIVDDGLSRYAAI